ncbi:MAG: hypothetical protein WBE26_15560 [Phycisphaerae bacterium]
MNLKARAEIRHAAQRSRRAPRKPVKVLATFDRGCELGDDITPAPVELTVEATNAELELAAWFDDDWWTEIVQRWADDPVAVHIAPTPGALLHPMVVHQLEMLLRVTPQWRLIGHTYVDDAVTEDDIAQLASSPYHEIRFIDRPRPGTPVSDRCTWKPSLAELLGRIRQEQSRLGATTPVLVRLPSSKATPSSPSMPTADRKHESSASPKPVEKAQ